MILMTKVKNRSTLMHGLQSNIIGGFYTCFTPFIAASLLCDCLFITAYS